MSVHPYREPKRGPETATPDYQKLRKLIDRYAPEAKRGRIPILSGEWGYSSWHRGVSEEAQAAFLVRQQLVNLLNAVPPSIWYDWKNDGSDPNENEHNFGTVRPDGAPKPAYAAVQTLARQLDGFRIARREPAQNEQDYLLACTNSVGAHRLVAWTTGEPHELRVPLRGFGRPNGGMLSNGTPLVLDVKEDQLVLRLESAPCYITVPSQSSH